MTPPGASPTRGPRDPAGGRAGRFDLLFVCTGNICRSPTAHLLAAARLPAEHFRVHSSGTYGVVGHPVEPKAARLLTKSGIGCDEFQASRLDADQIVRADLILTASREHRTAVVTLVPKALKKTFTMREFARLVEHVPEPRAGNPVDRARVLVEAVAAQRGTVWVPAEDDDLADPYGANAAAYERAFRDISAALEHPLRRLAGNASG